MPLAVTRELENTKTRAADKVGYAARAALRYIRDGCSQVVAAEAADTAEVGAARSIRTQGFHEMYTAGDHGGFLPPANRDEMILHWALWLHATEGSPLALWTEV